MIKKETIVILEVDASLEHFNVKFLACPVMFLYTTAAALGATLASHRSKPHVYIGCMKSGPVLAQK